MCLNSPGSREGERRGKNSVVLCGATESPVISSSAVAGAVGGISRGGEKSPVISSSAVAGAAGGISRGGEKCLTKSPVISSNAVAGAGEEKWAEEEDLPLQRAGEERLKRGTKSAEPPTTTKSTDDRFADFKGRAVAWEPRAFRAKIFAPKAEMFRTKATTVGATCGGSAVTVGRRARGKDSHAAAAGTAG